MAERKHSKMIKAWAENDELVVLGKYDWGWDYVTGVPQWYDREYFICLPIHNKVVLALLNGREVEVELYNPLIHSTEWYSIETSEVNLWENHGWYMSDDVESRIKPKKTTKYAYVHENGYIGNGFKTREELIKYFGSGYKEERIIKFEVEVI